MRLISPKYALLGLLLCCLLSGCSAVGGLKSRAADYYSFMVGLSPRTSYSSFLSPAYRKSFKRADLDNLNSTYSKAKTPTTRYRACKPGDVSVSSDGKFAITLPYEGLGDAYRNQLPVKWVKVGMGWYLYNGSSSEIKAYGDFPGGLAPPLPVREEAAETGGSRANQPEGQH